jgi:hypothetical protein
MRWVLSLDGFFLMPLLSCRALQYDVNYTWERSIARVLHWLI